MALILHACEKLLCHYQVYKSKPMDKGHKMEGYYHGQRWARQLLRKESC